MNKKQFTVIFATGFSALLTIAQDLPVEGQSPLNVVIEEPKQAETPSADPKTTNKTDQAEASFLISTGVEYEGEGEFKEAERAYLRALRQDPNSPDIRFRLGTLYIKTEQFKKGIELMEGLADEFPDNLGVRNNLAWSYSVGSGVKNMGKALRNAREALLIQPFNPSVWNTLAEAYYVAGDYDKALRSAEQALDLLKQTNPSEEAVANFTEQIQKISRAQEAWDVLSGLDEDD